MVRSKQGVFSRAPKPPVIGREHCLGLQSLHNDTVHMRASQMGATSTDAGMVTGDVHTGRVYMCFYSGLNSLRSKGE